MAKKRFRLTDDEAKALGFNVKKSSPSDQRTNSKPKYYLTEEQALQLSQYRYKGVIDGCVGLNIDPTAPKHLWIKDKNTSAFVPNPLYKDQTTKDYETLKENILEAVAKNAPTINTFKHEPIKDGHCLVISPADIHIGKLATAFENGKDYNSQIAVTRVTEGVKS